MNSDIDFNENDLFKDIVMLVDKISQNYEKNKKISYQQIMHIIALCKEYRQKHFPLQKLSNEYINNVRDSLIRATNHNNLIFVWHEKNIIDYNLDKILDRLYILLDNGAKPVQYANIGKDTKLNKLLYTYASDNIKHYFHENIRNYDYFSEIKTAL